MIGAGLSGICAAASLSALGHDCVLLEADNFAGGRVCSVPFSFEGSDASFDLGATWFWPETQPRMSALAALTGVDVFPQFFSGSVWVERFRLERAQRYIPATDIRTSAMRIAGGMKALIDARVASLPEQCLKLNHAVTAIEQRDDGRFCVSIAGIPTIHCEHIVLAIPPRQILQTITFNPALPVDVQDSFRKTPTWIAGQAKAVFVYRVPFWRERSHSGMVSSVVGPLQEIYDASPASGLGALFGFFNLSPSQRMLVSESQLKSLALRQLVRLFGDEAAEPIGFFYKDWTRRPYIASEDDTALPNGYTSALDVTTIEAFFGGRMTLAGSEFASEQNGYLEGALIAAESAVGRISASSRT